MSIDVRTVPRTPLGRWAGVALLVVAFAALALVAAFGERTLLRIDRPLQELVVSGRRGWLNELMAWVSLLGTRYVIGALILGVAVWTFATGRCRVALLVLIIAFAVNPAVEWALKEGVGRVRPELLPLGRGRGPSFPSGHVVASVGFYGMLPAIVAGAGAGLRAKATAFGLATAIIVAVGFSRMYIGVHWFTDVIGGFLIGTVVVLVTYRALRGHRFQGCPSGHDAEEDQISRVPSRRAR